MLEKIIDKFERKLNTPLKALLNAGQFAVIWTDYTLGQFLHKTKLLHTSIYEGYKSIKAQGLIDVGWGKDSS